MTKAKILLFAGSTRSRSLNHKLAQSIQIQLEAKGAETRLINLNDYEMPLYHEAIELEAIPQTAIEFAKQVHGCDGLVITSPEYNASLSPLLKNTLDWLSRVKEIDGKTVEPIKHKPVAIASCAPGSNGGIRGLSHLRDVLINLGALILSEQLAVANAMTAFDEALNLTNERANMICNDLCTAIIRHSNHPKA